MKQILLISAFISLGMIMNAQTFQWAKHFTGDGNNNGYSLAQNSSGDLYVAGSFEGTIDFDTGEGVYTLTSFGDRDAYIEKMDANGSLIWVKQIGGPEADYIRCISLGLSDNIYITGSFKGTADMDPGDDNYNYTSLGGEDMFVVELDEDGNFTWAGHMGGTLDDHITSIAVAPSGNVYIAGYYLGTADFEPADTAEYYLQATGQALFVEKLNQNNQFVWAKTMGGPGFDYCQSMCIDEQENVYTTGMFAGPADFDPGEDVFYLNSVGDRDIYMSKLSNEGLFVWAKAMGGYELEAGQGIVYDSDSHLFLTGNFQGTVDFDPDTSAYYMTSMGDYDIFTGKYDIEGNLIWMKQMGGPGSDGGYAITLDNDNNVYSTGHFSETADFDPGTGIFEMTSFGDLDIFISKLDASGNFVWAADMGGEMYDRGLAVMTDNQNNIFTTGMFEGMADFDPSDNNYYLEAVGNSDVFISKLSTELLGLTDHEQANELVVYPNPVNHYLNIVMDFNQQFTDEKMSLELIDLSGKVVIAKEVAVDQTLINLDMSRLPSGEYALILSNSKRKQVQKVIKN